MNLGFDLVVESDGPDRAEDAPTSASMREGARGGERRRPSTDEKKVKNRLRRQAGFDGDEADDLETVEGHILAAMAQPGRPWAELQALAAELEDVRSERRTAALTAADHRLADEVIHDHLTPVLTHIRHTSATDWIGVEGAGLPDALKDHQFGSDDDEDDDGDKKASMTNTVAAEASLWFSRVSAAVKADREEFAEQAQGMAARVAGQMAQGHPAATRAFLDRVAFLHRQAEIGPDGVKPWGMEDVHGRDPLMVDPAQSLADEDQSGGGESSLPEETTADPEPMDAEFWDDGATHEVPSTRAPNVTGSLKTAVSLTNVGIDSSTGNGTGTDPSGKKVQFRLSAEDKKALQGVLYSDLAVNFTGVDVDESEIITSASKTAAEGEGGSTCSSCGDPIERDPAGEDPRTWHHTNGEKHDHEASPGGGSDSKESSFRVQAARSLSEIAREISADWKNVYFGAVPYLQAMRQLDKITDNYGQDGADDIVIYFLSNATTWKGETARRIKAELKKMTQGRYGSKTAKKPCKFASEGNCSDDIIELWHGRSEPTYICGYHEQSKGQEKFSTLRVTAVNCHVCGKPVDENDRTFDPDWGDIQMHEGCLEAAAAADEKRSMDAHQKWWDAMDDETRQGYEAMGFTRDKRSIESRLAADRSGQGVSSLPVEPEGDDVDETMWPWEITKKTTDAAKTAEARCPYCGHIGCSPTCPGPAGMAEDRDGGGGGSYAICPNCGGGAARINGQVVCDHCGEGHEPGSMFDTDPESAQNRRFTRGSKTAGWQADLDKGIFSGGVDNVTKGMLRSVLEGLRPDNAEKFANMPLEQAVALGWRLVSGGVPRDPATFAALAAEAAKGDFLHGEDCGEPTDPTDNEGPCTKTLGHGGPHKGESKTSAFRSTVQANLARMGG